MQTLMRGAYEAGKITVEVAAVGVGCVIVYVVAKKVYNYLFETIPDPYRPFTKEQESFYQEISDLYIDKGRPNIKVNAYKILIAELKRFKGRRDSNTIDGCCPITGFPPETPAYYQLPLGPAGTVDATAALFYTVVTGEAFPIEGKTVEGISATPEQLHVDTAAFLKLHPDFDQQSRASKIWDAVIAFLAVVWNAISRFFVWIFSFFGYQAEVINPAAVH